MNKIILTNILQLLFLSSLQVIQCISEMCLPPYQQIVNKINVSSFLDNNFIIRLKILLEEPTFDESSTVYTEICIEGETTCDFTKECKEIPLSTREFIFPRMEITYPYNQIRHCLYDISLTAENWGEWNCTRQQTVKYNVPECVQNACQCPKTSPVNLTYIRKKSDGHYEITYKAEKNINTTDTIAVVGIYYRLKDYDMKLQFPINTTFYDNETSTIYLYDTTDLIKGIYYEIVTTFSMGNNCRYNASIELEVPEEPLPGSIHFIILLIVSLLLFLILLVLLKRSKTMSRIKRYFFYNGKPTVQHITEEYNFQYTPLDFILASHKFDKYEIPRNKIHIKEEIGKGAFGTVYYAKAYNIQNQPGYQLVAVKQLRDDAIDEEIDKFREEINILKKIENYGGHPNVVKLLACVTVAQPYMVVIELVANGSLKDYLTKLKEEWKLKKKSLSAQKFFNQDIEEDWEPESKYLIEESGKIKYTTCVFEDNSQTITFEEISDKSENVVIQSNEERKSEKSPISTPKQKHKKSPTHISIPPASHSEQAPLEEITPPLKEMSVYPKPKLDTKELQHFAYQIALGMAYLEAIPIVHRDLAARNILITEQKLLKISDFGMSRIGPYMPNLKCSKRIPLRWMSIEAIENEKYDSKSDVWSFAVVLWEIGALGDFPYKHIPDKLILSKLKDGTRLRKPEICTSGLYDLMEQCWSRNPDDRPSFESLVELLDIRQRKIYIDFDRICEKY